MTIFSFSALELIFNYPDLSLVIITIYSIFKIELQRSNVVALFYSDLLGWDSKQLNES